MNNPSVTFRSNEPLVFFRIFTVNFDSCAGCKLNNEAPGDTPNVDTLAGDIEQVTESVASSSLESSEPAKSQNIASGLATQTPSQISAGRSWIDDLIEFKETALPAEVSQMSIAEALYKLEASKDIPHIKLMKYNGNH